MYTIRILNRKEVIKLNARFNFIIPDELLERVKRIADERGVSTANVINEAIRNSLDGDRISDLEIRVAEIEKEIQEMKKTSK